MTDWYKQYDYKLLEKTKHGWDFHKVFNIPPDLVMVEVWNKGEPTEQLCLSFFNGGFITLELPKSLTKKQMFELVCAYYSQNIYKVDPIRRLRGKFYIELNKPANIDGHTCKYLLQVERYKPHYVWFNGCCGAQFAGKDYFCTGGYLTRKEAQEAIDEFQIEGVPYLDRGCGCCGYNYEKPDGSVVFKEHGVK